jgi:hypothetical protein
MSFHLVADVFARSRAPFVARTVLLAIADRVNEKRGNIAWCSIADLCERTGGGRSTVKRALARLKDLGELEVEYRRGPQGRHRYRVRLPETARPVHRHPARASKSNSRSFDGPTRWSSSTSNSRSSGDPMSVLSGPTPGPLRTMNTEQPIERRTENHRRTANEGKQRRTLLLAPRGGARPTRRGVDKHGS